MTDIPTLDEKNTGQLDALLKRYSNQPEIQGYPEAAGFLFAIVNGPGKMDPEAWMPFLLGEEPPEVHKPEDMDALMDRLLSLYYWTARDSQGEHAPGFPPGVPLSDKAEDNITADAPLSRWSRGFIHGMGVVAPEWERQLPQEFHQDFYYALMVMTAFEKKAAVEELHEDYLAEEGQDEQMSFTDYLQELQESLPDAMDCYAFVGNHVRHHKARNAKSKGRRAKSKPGRNDPCPCGSGKKYKKCCGDASVH